MRIPENRASTFIAIGALAVLVALACGTWLWLRPAGPRPKHVLILSVESLRWDHLGFAGYARPTSPHMDRLVSRGTYFQRAYAQAPWTRPSVASTFTSTYPSTHNAANDEGFGIPGGGQKGRFQQLGGNAMAPLAESFTTLAEIFGARGYRCFGWSFNPQVSQHLGFGQGFEEYDAVADSLWFLAGIRAKVYGGKDPATSDLPLNVEELRGVIDELIAERVTEMFRQKDRAPTMVFLHFMSPHLPYIPGKKTREMFATVPEGIWINGLNRGKINEGDITLSEADLAFNVDLYDATIRETDDRVGLILHALEESGLADETLVVLVADHGEEFYDHGAVGHGHTLYEELIHVPLVLAGPGIPAGKRLSVPVENIDLLPTLAGLLWEEELPSAQGRDLRRLLRGGSETASGGLVFSEHGARPGEFCAAIDGRWKLIVNVAGDTVELYDLSSDPGEQTNLAKDPGQHARVQRLLAAVNAYVTANIEESANYELAPGVETPEALLRQLRALGYIK